ncbi:MAG: hypothetical protein BA866_03810 [Desulfobulbaceae bacterium S5133MH15]|nr:MAG: hypothetical protein BA866_03810 [Desulfobulbaceae bacterium S5133MH15]OEU78928.1 MAG: hypothetical protein BA873_11870 [Desulfobulbaceae bacterium C00003063]
MKSVKEILADKGTVVMTITGELPIYDVVSIFHSERIGCLLVVDEDNQVLGIVGAKDIFQAVVHHYDELKTKPVSDIMTKNLIVGTETDDVNYIQAVITENRIRHIPIMEGNRLKGLVSIGDVVKAQLKAQKVENRYLKDYMADRYPA